MTKRLNKEFEFHPVRNPAVRMNGVCPYFTMYPLRFPFARLGTVKRGTRVLDPFCGRGTTNFAARLYRLASAGIDSNPVAAAVASGGGNNQLRFDPFHVQLIRVVDSYGKQLCLDAVSVTTDLQKLGLAQWNSDGTPKTPLGRMMAELGVASGCLNDLSHMMPKVGTPPEEIPGSWVQVYRELCEWAVLYELICHRPFATHTLVVRDGLLRSKMFKEDKFIRLREKMEEAIERIRNEDKRKIYLVGVAKRTKVL